MRFHERRVLGATVFAATAVCMVVLGAKNPAHAADGSQHIARQADGSQHVARQADGRQAPWTYPVSSRSVEADFLSPGGDYSAGHRGIDFASFDGEAVLAVASGSVRFAGMVAGRGVVSLDLDSGIVAEVEPVCPLVSRGERVEAGKPIGNYCPMLAGESGLANGGDDSQGASQLHTGLHLSARRFSSTYARGFAYFSPLLFLGDFARSHLAAIGSLD